MISIQREDRESKKRKRQGRILKLIQRPRYTVLRNWKEREEYIPGIYDTGAVGKYSLRTRENEL
jgi:hypothetical protein